MPDHPAPGQQHEAAFGDREFDHLQFDAAGGGSLGGGLTRVTLIDVSEFDALSSGCLHLGGQFTDLRAFLPISRGEGHGKQVAQRVYRDMDLAAFLAFVAVVICSPTALRTALHRAPIEDRSGGFFGAFLEQAHYGMQIVRHAANNGCSWSGCSRSWPGAATAAGEFAKCHNFLLAILRRTEIPETFYLRLRNSFSVEASNHFHSVRH